MLFCIYLYHLLGLYFDWAFHSKEIEIDVILFNSSTFNRWTSFKLEGDLYLVFLDALREWLELIACWILIGTAIHALLKLQLRASSLWQLPSRHCWTFVLPPLFKYFLSSYIDTSCYILLLLFRLFLHISHIRPRITFLTLMFDRFLLHDKI